MAITKTYDLLNINGVKGWVRDSWARRAIAALQQRVAGIVVPTRTSELTNDSGYITSADVPPGSTASSTTPLMDGTAAVGTENAFARGDHRHPSDTSKADKATTLAGYGITNAYTKTEVDGMIPTVPTKTSDLTNDSDFQTGTQVGSAISAEAGLMVPYGYCTTGASTVAKTVTVSPAVTELTTGLTIAVKMQYTNTGSNPTLNVNSLGAKAIKRYGTTAAGTSAAANWNANSVVMLVYDGTYWQLADWNNTTYSGMSDAEYQAGTGTSNRLITPARLKAAIELHAPVQSVNGQDGDVTVNVPTKTSDLTNDSGFITSAPVTSVNTKTGAVTLNASDVGALPSSTVIPTKTSDLTNDSGYITSAPVQSVNGQTGAVSLSASDVGALSDTTVIPSKTSQLTNDSGFLTSVPVTSVNNKTGAVSLTASDVGALPSSTAIPSATSDLTNDSGFITASSVPSASSATPAMDGTASAGSSTAWARGDHIHPHDTSKQDALSTAQMDAVNSGITADDLAVNDASVLCTVTPIEPTLLEPCYHSTTYGRCWYYKIGHHVHLHVGISGLTSGTTADVFYLPEGYRPYSMVSNVGTGTSMTNYSRLHVATDGRVFVNANAASACVDIEFDAFQ